jgi:hypothetical protein
VTVGANVAPEDVGDGVAPATVGTCVGGSVAPVTVGANVAPAGVGNCVSPMVG